MIETIGAGYLKEKQALEKRIEKEAQMISMLKMIDPDKAQEMEKAAKTPQINVIKVSGPGFFT